MKRINLSSMVMLFAAALTLTFTACQKDAIVDSDGDGTDEAAIKQLIEEDEDINSFEPNYNEDEAMDFVLGKVNTEIYPVRVGQRMRRSDFHIDINFSNDSAYVHVTKNFDGKLFIAASYDPFNWGDSNVVDTVIQKTFTSTITRNLIYQKIRNTDIPRFNWRLVAISLPEGGTLTENIEITKLTITMPDGNVIEIESPNDYYLTRDTGLPNQIPVLNRYETVAVQLNVQSAYSDTDFVTLTYGGNRQGHHRAKKRFVMISEQFDGTYYQRVYEQEFTTHQYPGHYHAVFNGLPKQALFDDASPVEENSWGIPYVVR